MPVRSWWLLTIMLTAVSMATALAHLLEMPAKLTYDGTLWLTLLQTLYRSFGTIGGACEVGAVVAAVVLVVLLRHRRGFAWAAVGALCMIAAHAAFWIWVAPVNAALVPRTPATLPADWTALRDQWEHTHAVRAVLQVVALGAFVVSLLVEVPPAAPAGRA
jgi:hypothetical protein